MLATAVIEKRADQSVRSQRIRLNAFGDDVHNLLAGQRARIDTEQSAHGACCVVSEFACIFRLYTVVGQAQLVHAARLLQLSQRSEKIAVRTSECMCNGLQAVSRGVLEAAPVCLGQHDQTRAVRQIGMERAQRMLDGVLAAAARQRFDKTCQRVRQCHIRACIGVAAVLNSRCQRFASSANMSLIGLAVLAR